jgi:hypothetical protein
MSTKLVRGNYMHDLTAHRGKFADVPEDLTNVEDVFCTATINDRIELAERWNGPVQVSDYGSSFETRIIDRLDG